MKKSSILMLVAAVGLLALAGYIIWAYPGKVPETQFDGQRAFEDVKKQVEFGPRTTGSAAQEQFIAWLRGQLESADWEVSIQRTEMMGHTIKNVIASRGNEKPPIILLTHYDSRLLADNDPDPNNQTSPVPGANDGASGVAVLLELARVLPKDSVPVQLLFVDAEDNGRIPGWDWILGSRAFVASLKDKPKEVILVDMIGDANLNIYMEKNSDPQLTDQIWATAKSLGYETYFIPTYKYQVIDDHIPFIETGIPAVDIIDLDYPYWHTAQDTPDKVSPASLNIVGKTLLKWITSQK
jgi:Zn-dependent M28 family amino/carboxypeptidase